MRILTFSVRLLLLLFLLLQGEAVLSASSCYLLILHLVRDERLAAWCQCAADAVTLVAPVSPCPNPAPEIGQLAEQLESRIQRVWELRWGNKWKEVPLSHTTGVVASAAARG